MSTKYQKPFTIPASFPALLKDFTREVLRAQPESIYEFAALHFQALLEQTRGSEEPAAAQDAQGGAALPAAGGLDQVQATAAALDIASLSPAELEPIILRACACMQHVRLPA